MATTARCSVLPVSEYRAETTNERLGRNLRALREHRGMSQTALAAAMSERRHAWHQQTVARAESGAQPLKADELFDLAAILETSLDRFTWTSPEASAVGLLRNSAVAARTAFETVAGGIPRLLAALTAADARARQFRGSSSPRVREECEEILARVSELGLDDAIAEGIRRYEERGDDA
jgi:transcriptional regulator with XRE-family HTH domain